MRGCLLVLLLFVAASMMACASQGASQGGSSDGKASTNIVDMNGCKVDPAPICNSLRGQTVDMSNTGLSADSRMLEQNSARTANVFVPIKGNNGDELFEVECGMNTLNQSVTWAQIKTGPKLTDEDVKFLRARGMCSEP
jgi:hypothetical protein